MVLLCEVFRAMAKRSTLLLVPLFIAISITLTTLYLVYRPLTEDFSQRRVHRIASPSELASIGIPYPPVHPLAHHYDQQRMAVMIENRTPSHLIPLMLHFITTLPPHWRVRFLGTVESINYLNSSIAIQHYERIGKLDLYLLHPSLEITSKEKISRTLTNPIFYSHIVHPAEYILTFQTDSILCSNAGRSIEEYLQYSYVGAPWPRASFGGNGGLSLRHVPVMLKLTTMFERRNGSQMEDLWIARRLAAVPEAIIASAEVEKGFSVEAIWNEEQKPLGFHLGNSGSLLPKGVWNIKERRDEIYEYCPEIRLILDMDVSDC